MRYLILLLFCLCLAAKSNAQETLISVGTDVNSRAVHIAAENDSVRAFALESSNWISFWLKVEGKYIKAGQLKTSTSKNYLGSICTAEDVYFIFDEGKDGLTQYKVSLKNGLGTFSFSGLAQAEGKPVSNFMHEGAVYNLSYAKKANKLQLRKFGLSGEAEDMEFTVPASTTSLVNVTSAELKKLEYRSPEQANPSLMYTKNHIFMSEDAMYLVYPKSNQYSSFFIIIKLGLQDGLTKSHVIKHIDIEHSNVYFHNNAFLLYMIDNNLLSLQSIDPKSWEITKLYTLSKKEEKLHDVAMQNETTPMWWDVFSNERMNQAKLLRKLSRGSAYVYINPNKGNPQQQKIVMGGYATGTNSSGGMGPGGVYTGPTTFSQYVIHPYTMMVYDAAAGTMAASTSPWKSPASVWQSLLTELKHVKGTPALQHLGDRALIAYIDKKRDAVVIRYEPLQQ